MKVRIRFRLGPESERKAANRKAASVAAALLAPIALMALALGVWRLSVDLDPSVQFPISRGFFSHWQVWIAVAGALGICASILNRKAHHA
jgi:hypothetical protein